MNRVETTLVALLVSISLGAAGCGDGDNVQPMPEACQTEPEDAENCNYGEVHIKTVEELEVLCETPCQRADELMITGLDGIEYFDGLDHLTEIGTLDIEHTDVREISAMRQLEELEGLRISANRQLETIDPWEGITEMQGIAIGSNDALQDFEVVPDLRVLTPGGDGLLRLSGSPEITELNGFENLESTDFLFLSHQHGVENFEGFESLEYIGLTLEVKNNRNLSSLSGLEQVTEVGQYVEFSRMSELTECEAEDFVDGLDFRPEHVVIEDLDEDC